MWPWRPTGETKRLLLIVSFVVGSSVLESSVEEGASFVPPPVGDVVLHGVGTSMSSPGSLRDSGHHDPVESGNVGGTATINMNATVKTPDGRYMGCVLGVVDFRHTGYLEFYWLAGVRESIPVCIAHVFVLVCFG